MDIPKTWPIGLISFTWEIGRNALEEASCSKEERKPCPFETSNYFLVKTVGPQNGDIKYYI